VLQSEPEAFSAHGGDLHRLRKSLPLARRLTPCPITVGKMMPAYVHVPRGVRTMATNG